MSIKIQEIAEKAGVSLMTISRAMNPLTRSKVAPATLKKIDRLIKKYGYTPSLSARQLRQTKTNVIGILLPYHRGIFFNSYYSSLLTGISDCLLPTNYQFKLLLLKEETKNWDHYNFRAGEGVDGLIITHWPKYFSREKILERLELPCAVISDLKDKIKVQFVSADHVLGGEMAAKYLYEKGHKNIAIMTGPDWSNDSKQRTKGFERFLKSKGLAPVLKLNGDYHPDTAYALADKIIEQKENITALFCCNDEMAFGVLRRLNECGLKCPDDLSIVGYDNHLACKKSTPPLTTIDAAIYDVAYKAAELLVTHLQSGNSSSFKGTTTLPVKLIERQSVKALTH